MASLWNLGDCRIEGITIPKANTHLTKSVSSKVSPQLPLTYMGETIKYEVIIQRDNEIDSCNWKNLVAKISCQVLLAPIQDGLYSGSLENDAHSQQGVKNERESPCTLVSTFTGNAVSPLTQLEPFFRDDDTFVFPMSSSLHELGGVFRFVDLQVTLSLFVLNAGHWPTSSQGSQTEEHGSSGEEEEDIFEEMGRKNANKCAGADRKSQQTGSAPSIPTTNKSDGCLLPQDSSGVHSVVEKTVVQRIQVLHPPSLKLRLRTAGQKHFLLLTVGNHTERQMVIKSIDILSNSLFPENRGAVSFDEGSNTKWESCHQFISLEHPRKNVAFPAIVSPLEELSLIHRVHVLPSVNCDMELSLRCSIKWTHAGASKEITTIFKLPSMKISHPLFVVTVKCEEEPLIDKSFDVTYTISNQLYDFMGMKLYYNLDKMRKTLREKGERASEEEKMKINKLKDAVICHDPITHTSSCLKGSSISLTVQFQIHQPGLYELTELMKVNLDYSLFESSPDPNTSRSVSSDTISSNVSTEEHLVASQQLWQNRSGSSASLVSNYPTSDERRKKFAGKQSYSFGDLGPSGGSFDSHEGHGHRSKTFKRSQAVPPQRPPPPRKLSQAERDLVNPSNFLKTPFYVYIKEPNT